MTRQGDSAEAPERAGTFRFVGALAIAALVCVAALGDRRLATAQARAEGSGDCVVIPNGSQARAICTYVDVPAIFFEDVVDAVGGSARGSGIWIQAWGGQGGTAPEGTNAGGTGGAGGYAQTYYTSLSSYSAALGDPSELYFYYGGNGGSNSSSGAGAGGGASTLVASANVTDGGSTSAYGPCIVADTHAADQEGNTVAVPNESGSGKACNQQSVVALAGGGGGGGGTCGRCHGGKSGGAGGVAVATSTTVVGRGSDGASPYPNRGGIGGFNGAGGRNHKNPSGNAGDGIGGLGGAYKDSGAASDSGGTFVGSIAFVGAETNGHGGRGYTFASNNGGDGGGGGGGFGGGGGGGQGGSSLSEAAGSGGGGGGSYAHGGDTPPGGGPPTGAPSADQGAVRIVIDGVEQPESPLASCAITQHGTEEAQTLRGTSGGDDIFGHGGEDSIATGRSQDCVHAGGDDDTVRGGRGPDTFIAAGGHDVLRGARGRDKISAEGGHHDVHGGRGADRIHARDSKRDTVSCGAGRDVAWVDASDRVARNCEIVHT